jgi:hypothetical protein
VESRTDGRAPRFDPVNLTVSASLNRARIVELPGIVPDPDVRGRTGYELLGAQALSAAIAERAAALGLDAACAPAELLPAFDRCLGAADLDIRATAHTLARRFGRSLGYLLLMLRRGDAANRRARADWDASVWEHWATVRTVWLGGGIASGELGSQLAEHAAAVLEEAGDALPAVRVATYPRALPLIGTARSLPQTEPELPYEKALVFDFGGTSIKRACAAYAHGVLDALNLLPPISTERLTAGEAAESLDVEQAAHRLADRMAEVIAETWNAAGADVPLRPNIGASAAVYIRDGHPLAQPVGVYRFLHELPRPASQWLARRVAERVGRPVTLTLLHDGTAAARTHAGVAQGAAIMLGTALGVGYSPSVVGRLWPVADGFRAQGSER